MEIPTHTLHVFGNTRKTSTGGDWDQSSDIRLKKNILPIKNALDTVMKLKGVTYMWKDPAKHNDEDGRYMGFSAQDAEKVIPEWVKVEADGYKLLNAIGANALFVEAIKELKAENGALEQRIEVLESKLNIGQ
ncbi:MAG: tail fiber domain-containing protein [Candidatus Omnitrophica bacterium]|nr:tail fiber domain-containing protein [Candidatus Omnitrophota bacterium]